MWYKLVTYHRIESQLNQIRLKKQLSLRSSVTYLTPQQIQLSMRCMAHATRFCFCCRLRVNQISLLGSLFSAWVKTKVNKLILPTRSSYILCHFVLWAAWVEFRSGALECLKWIELLKEMVTSSSAAHSGIFLTWLYQVLERHSGLAKKMRLLALFSVPHVL